MAQHFLLTAAARNLSLKSIFRMSDDEAHDTFTAIGFADNGGAAFCPRCQCTAVYAYTVRRIWKCKACQYQFSVTSGTIFASRKLAIRDYLAATAIFVNAVKGISALQLGRDLDVQYKTAFVARERDGKTLPFVVAKEADAVALIRERIAMGSIVHADEAGGWDRLHAYYDVMRINHSVAFSKDGACTNQAESYFSRLRRAELGQHHHISGKYLLAYAVEMAWREDSRRMPNGSLHQAATGAALAHPVSRVWAGYWQRG